MSRRSLGARSAESGPVSFPRVKAALAAARAAGAPAGVRVSLDANPYDFL